MRKWMKVIIDFLVVGLLVFIDQITKNLALSNIKGNGIISFIPGLIQFRYIENTGGAFSFLDNSVNFFIIATSIFLVVIVCYYLYQQFNGSVNLFYRVLFILVLAGGVGNLIDRIVNGFVVDFIEFSFFSFPIFNVADIYVTIVLIILVVYLFREEFLKNR